MFVFSIYQTQLPCLQSWISSHSGHIQFLALPSVLVWYDAANSGYIKLWHIMITYRIVCIIVEQCDVTADSLPLAKYLHFEKNLYQFWHEEIFIRIFPHCFHSSLLSFKHLTLLGGSNTILCNNCFNVVVVMKHKHVVKTTVMFVMVTVIKCHRIFDKLINLYYYRDDD